MNSNLNELKEEGNKRFKTGEYSEAIDFYLKALKEANDASECESSECRLAIYKNLAAAYLKLNDHSQAAQYASKAIELSPYDVKALFRRMQAFEQLKMYNEAFKDAILIQKLEPKNNAVVPILQRLNAILQESNKQQTSLEYKVKTMLEYLNSNDLNEEKRLQSANNILVLAKEKVGCDMIIARKGISLFRQLLTSNQNGELKLTIVRVLCEVCKHKPENVIAVISEINSDILLDLLTKYWKCVEEMLTAVQYLVQTILSTLTGFNPKQNQKPDDALMKKYEKQVDTIMIDLVKKCSLRILDGEVRDAILELISRNVEREALNWGLKLVKNDGLHHILEVSSQLEEVKYESSMKITRNTRYQVALTLERVYSCLDNDKAREEYVNIVKEYIRSKLMSGDSESKVEAIATITALLYGPIDVGNQCLSQEGIVEMMLVMAGADEDETQQRVAAEAIIAAASKKDKCTSIASSGSKILKKLYQSKNESIKVRALVGLCKIGSVGGTDASFRLISDFSITKLTAACKKYLLNPSKDRDLKKWACEGLAYLSLDADVKEDIIDDKSALSALIEIAKSGDMSILYGAITTFVNLTNSYDKKEILPEMLELAKFAKQHVPEEHEKDKAEYVERRCRSLAELKVTSALVVLSKTESKTSREMISRVFNAICQYQDLRGGVVQQGGTKVLLSLSTTNNTEKGKIIAAQALARIGITINPEVAFPGQRSAEVVRPLMTLLHHDCTSLQNFEALMALTNLAQVNESVQNQILKDKGYSKIEHFMYEEHELLRRASVQCTANLIMNETLVNLYEGNNDRVKFLVVLCEDDDIETAKAAAGALAMLTHVSSKACHKIFDAKRWFEILLMLVSSKDAEFQHRGVYIVNNLIQNDRTIAEKIVETNIFEVLMAIVRPEVDDISQQVKQLAKAALLKAQEYKLIKATEDCNLGDVNES
ncbi:Protein unc-45-like protein [Dinothrombium tinctorium]|uniref:Protein unc-45 homolog B n=1 Tax=Dinothrombium tinctorium TaxID=1965070 RepID=A0A3S3PAP6_9ACAR|nr:Protein unc-45-like protein [Dinothrombium tinctorium]RWS10673.1 Protein unc-45-like protein [Dinothrombium tinctorium]RWS11496.1 Protein unc-45-like protein [Dinothrombium tinctorium]RWS11499.1 Protein unc-45-like protein [Dinothrombium tinctorium]